MNTRNQRLAALVAGAILIATVGIVVWAVQWQYVIIPGEEPVLFRFNRFTNQQQAFVCERGIPYLAVVRKSSCSFEDR